MIINHSPGFYMMFPILFLLCPYGVDKTKPNMEPLRAASLITSLFHFDVQTVCCCTHLSGLLF